MPFEVVILKVCNGFFINYSYLAVDRSIGSSFLVDPAWDLPKIEKAIRESGTRCEFILLTHSHPDHADLANELAIRHNIPVYMSREEIAHYRFQCSNLRPVDEKDRIAIGRESITPVLTPGHTAGSMCFLLDGNLFTGDTLFAEGCGMCIEEGADPVDLFRSIQRLKVMIHAGTRIFPGHSYGQPPGQVFSKLFTHNIYLQFEKVEDFVAYRMRSGQTGWADFK
jgi:hydroxyacylglutathione hydrolase